MSDREKYIDKKIKELQDDLKLSFKMTEEVIDITYRQAVNDIQNFDTSNKESKKNVQKKPWSEPSTKTNTIDYQEKLEEYLRNKDDFEKFLAVKNKPQDGRQKRFGPKSDAKTLDEVIKNEKLNIYKRVINKLETSRDLLVVYDYCRQEIEKINNDIWV